MKNNSRFVLTGAMGGGKSTVLMELLKRGQVIFDRGVPDMLAYAKLFGLNPAPYLRAAEEYRYDDQVFYFPAWQAIYSQDDERKIEFEGAQEFGRQTRRIYEDLGYGVIEVPLVSIAERTQFILEKLKELRQEG